MRHIDVDIWLVVSVVIHEACKRHALFDGIDIRDSKQVTHEGASSTAPEDVRNAPRADHVDDIGYLHEARDKALAGDDVELLSESIFVLLHSG